MSKIQGLTVFKVLKLMKNTDRSVKTSSEMLDWENGDISTGKLV